MMFHETNDDGTIDEVAGSGRWHLEQMNDDYYCLTTEHHRIDIRSDSDIEATERDNRGARPEMVIGFYMENGKLKQVNTSNTGYDVDYCERDSKYYYHDSGWGGEDKDGYQMLFPSKKPSQMPMSEFVAMFGMTKGKTAWCKTCQDMLPKRHLCEHLEDTEHGVAQKTGEDNTHSGTMEVDAGKFASALSLVSEVHGREKGKYGKKSDSITKKQIAKAKDILMSMARPDHEV